MAAIVAAVPEALRQIYGPADGERALQAAQVALALAGRLIEPE